MPNLLLASISPRRIQLLRDSGYEFENSASSADEIHDVDMQLQLLCATNARAKAKAMPQPNDTVILAADTLVYIDDEPLGKPSDMAAAQRMLSRLSGRSHTVCTACCIITTEHRLDEYFVLSEVFFKKISDSEIQAYLEKTNPIDKAGAYNAQENTEDIITEIRGSQTNVIGLPMAETTRRLATHGVYPKNF